MYVYIVALKFRQSACMLRRQVELSLNRIGKTHRLYLKYNGKGKQHNALWRIYKLTITNSAYAVTLISRPKPTAE